MNKQEDMIKCNLRELRESRGLTVEGLAELSGVHPRTIVTVQCGRGLPSVATLLVLASALGVAPVAIYPALGAIDKKPKMKGAF